MKFYWWIIIAFFCLQIIALGFKKHINSRTHQFVGKIINRVKTNKKVIALTFDDGPTEKTNEILDLLDDIDVKATFFLNGLFIENNKDLTKSIVNRGHTVGNHAFTHTKMLLKKMRTIEQEVDKTNEIIRSVGYNKEIFFRAPYGMKLFFLPMVLKRRNMLHVSWNIDTYINVSSNAKAIEFVDFVEKKIVPGSIILMHPMLNYRQIEIEALPLLVSVLKAKGYQFKTIDEMMQLNRFQ